MNIKDFLIDNYIWIIVIILITIITIIGFLADKKKGGKKNKDVPVSNTNVNSGQPVNNMGPIQYQPPVDQMQNQVNNNMGMNFNNNLNNTVADPMNQMNNMQSNQNLSNVNNMNSMQPEQQIVSTVPTGINQMNNPQPVENVTPIAPQEPMYQPLSEQPVIQPQPVPNFSNMQNNQSMPQGTDNGLNPNMLNALPTSQVMQPEPEVVMPTQGIQQPIQNQNMVQTPNYNIPTPMQQPVDNNNFGNMPNFNQNNTTIPQPVSQVPTPQPVNPQPIMQDSFNVGQMPQTMNQPAQPATNQPINFVYGPQNNNQNM